MITETKTRTWKCDFCAKEHDISHFNGLTMPHQTFYLRQDREYQDSLEFHFCDSTCLLKFAADLATREAFGLVEKNLDSVPF